MVTQDSRGVPLGAVITFIGRFLRPYRAALVIVVVLLTMQVIANLYLPFLNADR